MSPSEGDGAGDLAIVLHSHMPYVEGFGTYPFGEEWLFDAVIRSYLPLLEVARDVTLTVTPVLADQLEDAGVHARLREFLLEWRIGAAAADLDEVPAECRPACAAELARYRRALELLEGAGGDPLAPFQRAAAEGRVALAASAATHAVLPLLASREGLRLQLDTGLRSHRRRFGPGGGFWLPECAYAPGLEHLLAEAGLDYFCTDQSAHEGSEAALRPVGSHGLTAFTIDWDAVQWLWSLEGYPADRRHADFHRKSLRGTRPWAIGGTAYDPEAATARAREQGEQFAAAVAARLGAHRERIGGPGLLTFAIDTELLGHWWWEGPQWLEAALAALPAHGVRPLRLREAALEHRPEQRELRRSSWGEGKDLRTWDSPPVADLAWGARRLELRLLREALRGTLRGGSLERAARELLAVQASDWAFLDQRRQAGDYPYQRVLDHANELFEAIDSPERADPQLRHLAPDLTLAPLLEP